VGDLQLALAADPLNYQAYFNLGAVQLREKQDQEAFKNLCCCLSVLHLVKGRREKSEADVEKAVEYSFNNKEARLLKSLLRLEAGKKIEALNQINYALYLDPSHPDLKRVQQRIYREMGMKELRAENKIFQKPKYDRLETNKEVPTDPLQLRTAIDSMFQDINRMVKALPVEDVYRVKAQDVEEVNNHGQSTVYHQKHIIRRLESSSFLKSVVGVCETDRIKIAFAKEKDEHSTAHNTLINSAADKHEASGEAASEQYLILDSSGSRLGDISISNISQNSKIKLNKVSRISNQILDVS
jgi:tetratricopeptide (TPR) repeat protein